MTSRVDALPISTQASAAWYSGARAERIAVRVAQVFLFSWVLFYLVNGLKAAFWFDGYPVNGPFQLYDPLRRLAAGQHAGTDFQFFHGIGVPFLHYPLFRLFGGDSLQASELSRQFTSYLLFIGTLAAFVWATFQRSATRWVAFAAGVLAIEAAFHRAAEPGHSFVSGRSAMPIFAFAVMQLRVSNVVKGLLTGVCIACAFLFGTEHGISLTLALVAVTGISVVQGLLSRPLGLRTIVENVKFLVLAGVIAAAGTAALFVAFCGTGGALEAIRYNLVELPGDQFWFFGSPPMPYLKDLRQLVLDRHVILCFLPTYVVLAGLVWLLALVWKKPLRLGTDWQALTAVMLTYAALTAIPLVGILSRHYVFPQMRISVLVVLLLLANVSAKVNFKARLPQWSELALPALFTAICGAVGLGLVYQATATASALSSHLREPAVYSKYLDSYWNSYMVQMTSAIKSHSKHDHLTLWSEYAAMLDARYGTFQPGEDYIIHTVGQARWHHYLDRFRKTDPEFVTTMNSQFSFAEWLQDERWEFYEELLNNYRPVAQIEHATLWQRQAGSWVNPAQDFKVLPFDTEKQTVMIPTARTVDEIVVVRIHYTVANPWRRLPLIGATPRYLVEVQGTPRDMAISLPPYVTEFQFPVKIPVGKTVVLRFKTDSFLPGASIHADEVRAKTLDQRPAADVLFAQRIVPSRY